MEGRDRHRSGEVPWEPSASDASDGVRRDEAADAAHRERPVLAAAGAGKLAAREQACQGQVAQFRSASRILEPLGAAAELYTPDAVLSAERSYVARAAAAQPEVQARRDAAELPER